ncbi:MAG: Stp1/IreP family PP2C-type Ser/Thr phosphatase [Clostridia bacterium]|nr:Stp1/IreP family PP2C-type Ser/Thr phosphatase [Clostridia bacterium]
MKTDKGIVRSMNQDACDAGEFSPDAAWAVVCDGMGGAPAGDIAAKTAVNVISTRIRDAFRPDMSLNSAKNLLTTAITAADILIYDDANENVDYRGMGTTIVACMILNDMVVCAFAGDSRAYILHDDTFEMITHDHSLVQEKIDAGLLSEDDAAKDPDRNLITRALGVTETINIDFSERDFKKGDRLILCTDGLTNFVSEDTIAQMLRRDDIEVIPDELIRHANEAGGRDNITAVVIVK